MRTQRQLLPGLRGLMAFLAAVVFELVVCASAIAQSRTVPAPGIHANPPPFIEVLGLIIGLLVVAALLVAFLRDYGGQIIAFGILAAGAVGIQKYSGFGFWYCLGLIFEGIMVLAALAVLYALATNKRSAILNRPREETAHALVPILIQATIGAIALYYFY